MNKGSNAHKNFNMKAGSIELEPRARFPMSENIKSSLLKSNNLGASDNSWEEEDGDGYFSAFTWPPRSYNCNFCSREFRSAQALGGHMNVHRKDRARLKQSPSSQNEFLHHHQPHQHQNQHYPIENQCKFGGFEHPLTLAYSPNRPRFFVSTQLMTKENYCHKPDTSVSLKLVNVGPDMEKVVVDAHLAENNVTRKRRRTDELALPFFPKSDCSHKHHRQEEIMGNFPNATEGLDLELRLGIRPMCKVD